MKAITWMRLLRLLIGLKISRQFFNQWEAKPNPISACKLDFSRAFKQVSGTLISLLRQRRIFHWLSQTTHFIISNEDYPDLKSDFKWWLFNCFFFIFCAHIYEILTQISLPYLYLAFFVSGRWAQPGACSSFPAARLLEAHAYFVTPGSTPNVSPFLQTSDKVKAKSSFDRKLRGINSRHCELYRHFGELMMLSLSFGISSIFNLSLFWCRIDGIDNFAEDSIIYDSSFLSLKQISTEMIKSK